MNGPHARHFKTEGFDVMIGGFHVSGAMATARTRGRYARKRLSATMYNRLEAIRETVDGLARWLAQ